MARRRWFALAGIAGLLAGCGGGGRDAATIPVGYGDVVESARRSLSGHVEGLIRPSLSFTGIRCYENGGLIVFFRQVGGLSDGEPAFAMGGPGAAGDAWSGGFGDAAEINEEIEFNFGDVSEVSCPPRGAN